MRGKENKRPTDFLEPLKEVTERQKGEAKFLDITRDEAEALHFFFQRRAGFIGSEHFPRYEDLMRLVKILNIAFELEKSPEDEDVSVLCKP